MTKTNIKASNSIMSDKQFKLSDLILEFFRFRTNKNKTHMCRGPRPGRPGRRRGRPQRGGQ